MELEITQGRLGEPNDHTQSGLARIAIMC